MAVPMIMRVIMAMMVVAMMVVVVVVVVMLVVVTMGMMIVIMMMVRPVMIMVVVMLMIWTMIVPMDTAMAIGPALGVEGCLDRRHGGAKPAQHRLDDVIAADAQTLAEQLGRQMAIAQMPGDAHKMGAIAGRHLGECLRRRLDSDDAAILQHEPVAMFQRHSAGQIKQEGRATLCRHHHTPTMARVKIENDRVGSGLGPETGRIDGNGADHVSLPWNIGIEPRHGQRASFQRRLRSSNPFREFPASQS